MKRLSLRTSTPASPPITLNLYVVKIDPRQPLVKLAETSIYFQAFCAEDTTTSGTVAISADYGKTWKKMYQWTTENTKQAKRRGNWHCADLRPVFRREPGKEVDELQVRFDCDNSTIGLHIQKVLWVSNTGPRPSLPPSPAATRGTEPTEPPDEKVLAEDIHHGIAANHPSSTKANLYTLKIASRYPRTKVGQTSIYFQAFCAEDTTTNGSVSVSADYGKTWRKAYDWTTQNTKQAKRRGNWHSADLSALYKKEPDTATDELQVRFDSDGSTIGLHIERVLWVSNTGPGIPQELRVRPTPPAPRPTPARPARPKAPPPPPQEKPNDQQPDGPHKMVESVSRALPGRRS